MSSVYDTLFLPLGDGRIKPQGRALFLNAAPCEGLALLEGPVLQQYLKPQAAALQGEGYTALSDIPEEGDFDAVILAAPKNITEARFMIARGINALKEGGMMIVAAANDAGGARLAKLLGEAGLGEAGQDSKNKARVAWAKKTGADEKILEAWTGEGGRQPVLEGRFVSMPGIFGWDKIDQGSAILARHLPPGLKGRGADFGCGYGFLSSHVLSSGGEVAELACVDSDFRAITCARQNLEKHGKVLRFFWEDLRVPPAVLRDLDFIVMNPPFHEGKESDAGLGQGFIGSAAASLRAGGALWMVANATLPYEKALAQNFSSHEKIFEGEGFKVFKAAR